MSAKRDTQIAFTARHSILELSTAHKFLMECGAVVTTRAGLNAAIISYMCALIKEHSPHSVVTDYNVATAYLRKVGLLDKGLENREQPRLIKSLALEAQGHTSAGVGDLRHLVEAAIEETGRKEGGN